MGKTNSIIEDVISRILDEEIDEKEKRFTIIVGARGSGKTQFLEKLCNRLAKEIIELKEDRKNLKEKINSIYGSFNYQDTDSIRCMADSYFSDMRLRQEIEELKHDLEEANQQKYILEDINCIQKMIIEQLTSKPSKIQ